MKIMLVKDGKNYYGIRSNAETEEEALSDTDMSVDYSYGYEETKNGTLRIGKIINHSGTNIYVELPSREKVPAEECIYGQISLGKKSVAETDLICLKIPEDTSVAMSPEVFSKVYVDVPDHVSTFRMHAESDGVEKSWVLFADKEVVKEALGEDLECELDNGDSISARQIDLKDTWEANEPSIV